MSQLLNEHLVLPPLLLLLRHALVLVLVVVVVVLVKIRLLLLVVLLLTMLVLLIILMGVYVVVQCRNVHRWWTIVLKKLACMLVPRVCLCLCKIMPLELVALGSVVALMLTRLFAVHPVLQRPRPVGRRRPELPHGDEGRLPHGLLVM